MRHIIAIIKIICNRLDNFLSMGTLQFIARTVNCFYFTEAVQLF